MSFFVRQDRARRNTRLLVVLFVLTALAIVLAVNFVVLGLFGLSTDPHNGEVQFGLGWQALRAQWELIAWTTLITGGGIALASFYRVASLGSGGGGEVARALGGTRVDAESSDPLLRRYYNVVEEMALASGISVPEVYVLEREQGINAFAAGFTSSDAAVAVTRGALEGLNRDELQGVVAHEFSHILNGDMRLNMRLMGVLFGILVVALIGRLLLRVGFYSGLSRQRNGAGAAFGFAAAGMAVMAIGYIGLFGAKLIKAAVSRQREYLADASAVQFTRYPDGIAGALKKIGGFQASSQFTDSDPEEVSHMLFASGLSGSALAGLLATHPPLEERIRAIDPAFRPEQFTAAEQARQTQAASGPAAAVSAFAESGGAPLPAAESEFSIDPQQVVDAIGSLSDEQIIDAQRLHDAIPAALLHAAHQPEEALRLFYALLLNADPAAREEQLRLLGRDHRIETVAAIEALAVQLDSAGTQLRLPLFDIAFPALRRLPSSRQQLLHRNTAQLIEVDGKVDIYEYALSRLLSRQLDEAADPGRRKLSPLKLIDCTADAEALFALTARVGHAASRDALDACRQGLAYLLSGHAWQCSLPEQWEQAWPQRLDAAMERLDRLDFVVKEELVAALVVTIRHNGKVNVREAELLRTVCALLHCPLPVLHGSVVAEI